MAVDRWSSEEMGEHARVRTGVEVADDDALAEPRLGPEGAGPHPAALLLHPQELPRPRRVQPVPPVREHGHHARVPCESDHFPRN